MYVSERLSVADFQWQFRWCWRGSSLIKVIEMASRSSDVAYLDQISIRGAKLAYKDTGKDTGKGENLVLVHANISDIRSWDPIAPLLASEFRVIVYSRRYAWPNDEIVDGVADPWEDHADDLAEMMENLGIAQAHILGNSTGATVALLLARRRPHMVKTLILEEPPLITLFLPTTPPSLTDVARLLWLHPWSFLPTMNFGATVVGPTTSAFKRGDNETALKVFSRGVLGPDFDKRLSQERRKQMRDNFKPHRALLCYGELPKFLDADVERIQMPVLVLTGMNTATSQLHINRRLAVLLPDVEEVEIQGASHLMHEDQPEDVVRAIIRFVASVGSRATDM
ncbi:hypothetical protein H2198_007778 [Neophaeococcomyces mojaviensis]|uniref:Uncharacterized protein n=1 Tax=Neophaeococcomyces mojaviensis TaxID=3383035 RepID=A0ACC2ZZI4_9EURO|nr:hypothetical protein H2198_007778 [Knufia sp. JES_112]